MRFYGNMTQSQIAEATGVSQMHVSRLLKGALGRLREELTPAACESRTGHASRPPREPALPAAGGSLR